MNAAPPTPLLAYRDVHKTFGAVKALRGASLEVAEGTVHGLVGHNGAGKSTLVKIVSGSLGADAGELEFAGERVLGTGRGGAIERGVWAVPQELTVLPDMSVADNISVGGEPRRGPFVSRRALLRRARETMDLLGLPRISVDAAVEDLRPSEQRIVMIAMAVSRDCRLLILDEPTASLGADEAQPLLALVEGLPAQGITVLYVSHRLDEIERLCDRVTVMRDGCTVDVLERGGFDARGLVGRMVEELPEPQPRRRRRGEEVSAVRIRGLYGRSLRGLDVEIAAGRITGFTGLVGSGADELLEVVAGAARPLAGTIELGGAEVSFSSEADALHAGVGYLPGSRAGSALTDLTVRENVLASCYERISHLGAIVPGRERRVAVAQVERFGLAERVERPLSELSGGNQQKVLVARLIAAEADVVVVNDPTAGVDVRARADLHALLRELADAGRAVIVRCSEPEELLDLVDRIHVLAGGRLVSTMDPEEVVLSDLLAAAATSGAEVPKRAGMAANGGGEGA